MPVAVGYPLPPLTAIVTVNGCAVVMLADDGVTVTVGVVLGGAFTITETDGEVEDES